MPLKDEMARAQAAGAVGYIPKSLSWNELVSAIRRAIAANEFVNYTLPPRKTGLLTQREETVLKYLNLGKTYDEIAIILSIGRETVKTHVRSLKEKLEATSAAGLWAGPTK